MTKRIVFKRAAKATPKPKVKTPTRGKKYYA